MRLALVAAALAGTLETAAACPHPGGLATEVTTSEAPATAPCIADIEWGSVHRIFEVQYALGAGGTTRSGIGSAASGFAALDLAYALQFGSDPDEPTYEIGVFGGVAAQRFAGAIEATGLVTRAGLHLGPARVGARVVEEHGNIAVFPMTLELAHTGELAARPRISDRPQLARSLYGRERLELATRVVRVESAGSKAGSEDELAGKSSSWAIDALSIHGGVDLAMQDATRIEVAAGGALLGAVDHSSGSKLDLFGLEYRRISNSRMAATDLFTLWMLKVEGVNPATGSTYTMGWGEVVLPEELAMHANKLDVDGKTPTIGGFGWYTNRRWGGWGAQYKREAFITMTGEIAIEDRVNGEVYFPALWNLAARPFVARTQRLVAGELVADVTAGVELGASYARDGWSAKAALELGRTYYTVLDGAMPDTPGFVTSFGLTMQHAGARAWKR